MDLGHWGRTLFPGQELTVPQPTRVANGQPEAT